MRNGATSNRRRGPFEVTVNACALLAALGLFACSTPTPHRLSAGAGGDDGDYSYGGPSTTGPTTSGAGNTVSGDTGGAGGGPIGGDTSSAGGAQPMVNAVPDCGDCSLGVEASDCVAELAACTGSQACNAVIECLAACADIQCEHACAKTHPSGMVAYGTVFQCIVQDCGLNGCQNVPDYASEAVGCDHDECDTGAPMNKTCTDCTETICSADPWCCEVDWDAQCTGAAKSACGYACPGSNGSSGSGGCSVDCSQFGLSCCGSICC